MRAAPLISLALSIIVGIAAVVFGRGWLNSEADAANTPVAIAAEVATQPILVVNDRLERGDLLTKASFKTVDWPVEHLPEGVLSEAQTILAADGSYPYALGLMLPGEPLIGAKLSPIAVRDTLDALIEPGFRAVSIEVNDASGVAGFVLPDARVDVNVFTETERRNGPSIVAVKTLLQDVRVLAVDQLFSENLEGAAVARTVTLQVTPEDAQALGAATLTGRIGLALRGRDDVTILPPPPAPTPRRVVTRRAAPRKTTTTIRVIQGEDEETVTTPVSQASSPSKEQNK